MQDNTLMVLGLVGLGVICLGLMLILFLAMLRFTGHHMLGFFTFWGRGGDNDKDDGTKFIPSPKRNLRSIAQAEDFDTALAKHIVQDEIEPRSVVAPHVPSAPSAYTVSPAPPPAPFPDALPRLGSRSSNGNGRVHHNGTRADDDEEDDALADFLGDS